MTTRILVVLAGFAALVAAGVVGAPDAAAVRNPDGIQWKASPEEFLRSLWRAALQTSPPRASLERWVHRLQEPRQRLRALQELVGSSAYREQVARDPRAAGNGIRGALRGWARAYGRVPGDLKRWFEIFSLALLEPVRRWAPARQVAPRPTFRAVSAAPRRVQALASPRAVSRRPTFRVLSPALGRSSLLLARRFAPQPRLGASPLPRKRQPPHTSAAALEAQLRRVLASFQGQARALLGQLRGALQEARGVIARAKQLLAKVPATSQKERPAPQTEFNVILRSYGSKKIDVINAVRSLTGLDLKNAKDLVESAPVEVKRSLPWEQAQSAKRVLEAAGAQVDIK